MDQASMTVRSPTLPKPFGWPQTCTWAMTPAASASCSGAGRLVRSLTSSKPMLTLPKHSDSSRRPRTVNGDGRRPIREWLDELRRQEADLPLQRSRFPPDRCPCGGREGDSDVRELIGSAVI